MLLEVIVCVRYARISTGNSYILTGFMLLGERLGKFDLTLD